MYPGSRIFSDSWGAYLGLNDLGYSHYTVVHKTNFKQRYINQETGVTVYLAPLDSLPPGGGKLSRDILPPTLVIFTPGGQAVQAGLSCPPPTQVKIYVCYFVIFLYHFNEFRSYTSLKVRKLKLNYKDLIGC